MRINLSSSKNSYHDLTIYHKGYPVLEIREHSLVVHDFYGLKEWIEQSSMIAAEDRIQKYIKESADLALEEQHHYRDARNKLDAELKRAAILNNRLEKQANTLAIRANYICKDLCPLNLQCKIDDSDKCMQVSDE